MKKFKVRWAKWSFQKKCTFRCTLEVLFSKKFKVRWSFHFRSLSKKRTLKWGDLEPCCQHFVKVLFEKSTGKRLPPHIQEKILQHDIYEFGEHERKSKKDVFGNYEPKSKIDWNNCLIFDWVYFLTIAKNIFPRNDPCFLLETCNER